MPRQSRLDDPAAWHHVMGRGIERAKVFQNSFDRTDFLNQLSDVGPGAGEIHRTARGGNGDAREGDLAIGQEGGGLTDRGEGDPGQGRGRRS